MCWEGVVSGGDATGVLDAIGSTVIGSDLTVGGVNGVVGLDDAGDGCGDSP